MEYTIKLDARKSAAGNAESFYEEAKKAKQKLAGAKKALEDTQKKIRDLEEKHEASVAVNVPQAKKEKDKKWFDKFHSFNSSDGFFVAGGKDATTNDILIKKHTEKDDIVFHADVHGAPFFVVKNPDQKEVPESTLKEAADAAASYSKAWKLGMGSCDVYYVKPDQVSKTAPSGEYLAKGGFMIQGRKEWLRGVRLQIAVGFRKGTDGPMIAGPVSAVGSQTSHYVKITPGDMKSEELAKEIKRLIQKRSGKEDAEWMKGIRLEEIQRLIPGGKGRVVT
jgi:predicted ribosome quality control (RQC) complex YloA/Tae2 family protein